MDLNQYPATKTSPRQLLVHTASQQLQIEWEEGESSRIPFSELRRYCGCAWCRKSGRIGSPPPADGVDVVNVNLVGDAGLQFFFADGHSKGFYSWHYLQRIADGTVAEC